MASRAFSKRGIGTGRIPQKDEWDFREQVSLSYVLGLLTHMKSWNFDPLVCFREKAN
jgi:hypothetical protein